MAKKQTQQKSIERTYVVPLRRETLKSPRYKRAKKAVRTVKDFLGKHMKSDKVKIGTSINLAIWKNGIKNPPNKIKVTAVKDAEGIVKAELFGVKTEQKKEKKKKLGLFRRKNQDSGVIEESKEVKEADNKKGNAKDIEKSEAEETKKVKKESEESKETKEDKKDNKATE